MNAQCEDLKNHRSDEGASVESSKPIAVQVEDDPSVEVRRKTLQPPLTSFGYLDVVSRLVKLREDTIQHLTKQPWPGLASFQDSDIYPRQTALCTNSGSVPFSENVAQYLMITYRENVEAFLPIFGHRMASRDSEALFAEDMCSEDPNYWLAVRLSMAVALALLMASPKAYSRKKAPSQVNPCSFPHWSQQLLDTAMTQIKSHLENVEPCNDEGDLPTVSRSVEQRRALGIACLLLVLTIHSLFLPQRGSSRQLLGFLDRVLPGHYEAVRTARGSLIDIHPAFLPSDTSGQLTSDILEAYRTFLTLEKIVAMAEGLPISHVHNTSTPTIGSQSNGAGEPRTVDETDSTSALFTRLIDIKWTVHSQCLSMLACPSTASAQSGTRQTSGVSSLMSTNEARLSEWKDQWIKYAHASLRSKNISLDDQLVYLSWFVAYGEVLHDEAQLLAF